MISSKILKKEIKIGKVIREDDEYKVLDMDKDGNVISVKSLEDLLEDFVDLEGVNIKLEHTQEITDNTMEAKQIVDQCINDIENLKDSVSKLHD